MFGFFLFYFAPVDRARVKGGFAFRTPVGRTAKQLVVVAEQQSMVDISQLTPFRVCKAAYAVPLVQ